MTPKRRHLPYVGRTVEVRWNSGNDNHPDEHIEEGRVIDADRSRLWVYAQAQGIKPEQDVFIKYEQITMIREVA